MRWKRILLVGICVSILIVVLLFALRRPEPQTLYRVTFLPSPGGGVSLHPRAINDHGQVVGVAQVKPNQWHTFLWDKEAGMRDLGPCADPRRFECVQINNAGQIAGTAVDPNGAGTAFLQDPNGPRHILRAPGDAQVHVRGLNNRGQVVGYHMAKRGPRRAFVWDKTAGMQDLGAPDVLESLACGINDAGQVVGFLSVNRSNQWYAFLWGPNVGMQNLGLARFGPTRTCQINNSGFVVGQFGSADDETRVSIWTTGTGTQRLPPFRGASLHVAGLNEANRFVTCADRRKPVFERRGAPVYRDSYLWDPSAGFTEITHRLGRHDIVQFVATDINNKGRITGQLELKNQPDPVAVVLEPIR